MFREFLNEPRRLAQVSAVSQSGLPLLGSLWFWFDAGRFWFHSAKASPLVKAAQHGRAIAALVDDFDPPNRIIQVRVRGEGSLEPHDPERIAGIYGRYIGDAVSDWPLSFPERLSDLEWSLWSVQPQSGMVVDSSGFIDQHQVRWNTLAECPL